MSVADLDVSIAPPITDVCEHSLKVSRRSQKPTEKFENKVIFHKEVQSKDLQL